MFGMYEKVVVVTCPKYADRMPGMRAELARVGIERYEVSVGVVTPFERMVAAAVDKCRLLDNEGMMNSLMNHYRVIKTALESGVDSLLVIEDDVRFVKDLTVLERLESVFPFGELQLWDWWLRQKATEEEAETLMKAEWASGGGDGVGWKRFENLRSAACYGLNRWGMAKMVYLIEAAATGVKYGKLRVTDQYWPYLVSGGLNCFCAFPCGGVQGYQGGNSLSRMEGIWKRYNRMGIGREEYGD